MSHEKAPKRNISFEEFSTYVYDRYFREDLLEQYITKQQSDYSPQILSSFFRQPVTQKALAYYWTYENDPKWKNRSSERTIFETVKHALTIIATSYDIFIESIESPGLQPEYQSLSID